MKKNIIILLFFSINSLGQTEQNAKTVLKDFFKILIENDDKTIKDFSKIYAPASIDNDVLYFIKDSLSKEGVSNTKNLQQLRLERKKKLKDNQISYILRKIRIRKNIILKGLKIKDLYTKIDSAKVIDNGLLFSVYLVLQVSDTNKIYFEMNKDLPIQITNIWLDDGDSFEDKIFNNSKIEKLLFPGVIYDTDGFVNIRKEPKSSSIIVSKIKSNEIVFFVPNSNTKWLIVCKSDNFSKVAGYIYRDKIITYENLPKKAQKKIINLRK